MRRRRPLDTRLINHPAVVYHMPGTTMIVDKRADLAGPGIGDYEELEKLLPQDYTSLLNPKETQKAIFAAKNYIEENLCRALNLMMVTVPLIDRKSTRL